MSKFEAILRLSGVQESLLLHRLFSDEDKGELHILCDINGAIEKERFERAWQETVRINQVLRATIHWKDIKRPVQIVHPTSSVAIEWIETLDLDSTTEDLMIADRKEGLDISSLPPYRLRILITGEKRHRLLLHCHHILVDGWSSVLILKDIVRAYDFGYEDSGDVRPGMKAYLTWAKRVRAEQAAEKGDCEHFRVVQGVKGLGSISNEAVFKNSQTVVPEMVANHIAEYSREIGASLNTLYQGAWAILLHGLSNNEHVAFGSTVSGRMNTMSGIEEVTGMLTNVVPVFSSITQTDTKEWLRSFQNDMIKSVALETLPLSDLYEFADKVGKAFVLDTLFTFENFPWEDIQGKEWFLSDFRGGMTSNYPISITVLPSKEVRVQIQFDTSTIDQSLAERLLRDYVDILKGLSNGVSLTRIVDDVMPFDVKNVGSQALEERSDQEVLPVNEHEMQILNIWRRVLKNDRVNVLDDYFSLGGKSVQALQIFSEIQKYSGKNLPPATLLEFRSVRALASQVSGGRDEKWSSLVPLNITGDASPLFCIHAGGAHVFIYREMAELFENERAVFGIQPFGLEEGALHNQSIHEMATAYLREIKSVVGEGPINVLGYCFSAAIVAEMIQLVSKESNRVLNVIIVDSAPGLTYGRKKLPLLGRVKKLIGMFGQGQWSRIKEVLEGKWDATKSKYFKFLESEQMRNFRRVEAQLAQLYTSYRWKESKHKIELIRSSEFANRSDKNIHLEEWRRLQGDHLGVHVVRGKHNDLFTTEYVTELGEKVRGLLAKELDSDNG